ncbi:Pathogenesis-related protein 5 [Choanephora cucurbitarum]|uniref:Pathogenesis-related protein 5 n=1 Tax=Choanephora cucurbitarum TaxID=101091 RepID=A0A1C7NNY1_9FUNG|nr:Pathogenesis-related protein 5 [Choanephora cucurbitarum]
MYATAYLIYIVFSSKSIVVQNNCKQIVSVGVLTNGVGGGPEQSFDLTPGASNSFSKPDQWGGRVWGRYSCSGSSGKNLEYCNTPGASNPASLAEFFFKGSGGKDFYDISLVDGYNIPMSITPSGGGDANGYSCGSPQCQMNECPAEYAVKDATGNIISCQSACSKTGTDEHCCTGSYNDPNTCTPSGSSAVIKEACPDAYSFAYDDQTSTFQCEATSYTVSLC